MTKLEKAEKIIEKTGVCYEDAKAALDACGEDILDAIVMLENQGKVKGPARQSYTTGAEHTGEEFQQAARAYDDTKDEKLGSILIRFMKWCSSIVKKGCENYFIVRKHGEEIINAPVIVLVLLLFFAFWAIVPILIAGLFFGFRYSFSGKITEAVDLNKACDKASAAAEAVKREFTDDVKRESSGDENKKRRDKGESAASKETDETMRRK